MSDIIVNPEYQKILEEIQQLKENISKLYQEKDELIYHICKNIETDYMTKIGTLEYKVFEFKCKILRLQRKIELYQAKINRQEKIDVDEIENQLDVEYKEYEKELEGMYKNLQNSLERMNGKELTLEQSDELKKIYRKLIKKLHPDLSNNNTEKNKELLNKVILAYENGDLIMMKNLELLCEEITDIEIIAVGELDELKEKKDKYNMIVKSLLEAIKKIKESFPYNQREFLNNEILIKEKKNELNATIEMYKETYKGLEAILEKMKGD